jgi:hypothetical protein
MEKCWYIVVDGATLGPFTPLELKAHPDVNPDTLVWRDGMAGWVPLRDVPELQEIFKDDGPAVEQEIIYDPETDETLVAQNSEPPYFIIWLAIAVILFIYILTQFFTER